VSIDIAPETERLIREAIDKGDFKSVDEIIIAGVDAKREKDISRSIAAKSLIELAEPIRGLFEEGELDFSRNRLPSRPVNLG